MGEKNLREETELRRKRQRESFSNYENAVTLICSLEAWFEYRWGPRGKAHADLLECFDRFPDDGGLTPDFEVRFRNRYIIWGDHKRTIQPAAKGRDDVDQILKYAARRPSTATPPMATTVGAQGSPKIADAPHYDVVVLVSPENDDVAAEAINVARQALTDQSGAGGGQPAQLAPIIVLGCHLDRESIEGEWYKIKWRGHHDNCRFSNPNISANPDVEDLNALITAKSHHAIPVNKPALGLTGRNPLINDTPPAIYTAIRLLTPAINALLSDDERDQLQSTGKLDKIVTKTDVLEVELMKSMKPQPRKLGKWIEAALGFLTTELNYGRKMPGTDPQQYVVSIDNALIKGDLRELFSDRAASRAANKAANGSGRGRPKGDRPGQMKLFD